MMATRFSYHPVFDFNNSNVTTDEDCEFITDDSSFFLYNIKTEPSDAATQTELKKKLFSTKRSDPLLCDLGLNNQDIEQFYGRYSLESLNSPINRRRTNGGRKERTPRTLLKLMERHRHNERVRHHTLNERLRVICKFVPGSGEDGRETKVVMMQRIISYIAYLENTISHLRSELGLNPDPTLAPLTMQLRRQIEEFSNLAVVPDVDGTSSSSKRPRINVNSETSTPRRYKISSPTVDSTTDRTLPDLQKHYHTSQESSQDSMAPTSTFFPYNMATDNALPPWLVEEPMVHSNGDDFEMFFDPIIEDSPSESYMNDQYHLQMNSSAFNTPIQDSFTILSSPSSSKKSIAFSPDESQDILGDSMHEAFGFNGNANDDDFLNSFAVSPDTILPIRQQLEETYEDVTFDHPTIIANNEEIVTYHETEAPVFTVTSSVWSPQHKNKRKQYTPTKREPLQNLTSNSPFSLEDSNEPTNLCDMTTSPTYICKDKKPDSAYSMWTFHTMNDTVLKKVPEITKQTAPTDYHSMQSELHVVRDSRQEVIKQTAPKAFQDVNDSVLKNIQDPGMMITKPIAPKVYHLTNNSVLKEVRDIRSECPEVIKQPTQKSEYHPPPCKDNKPQKIDHRKTSWMNGFMMYSRLNRREFINANPGVHTSNISKLMGQSWRAMTSELQQPYKDKAKLFLKEMQKIQDLTSQEEVTQTGWRASTTNKECHFQQVPVIHIPNTTSMSTSKAITISAATHPIYNSQRWTYL